MWVECILPTEVPAAIVQNFGLNRTRSVSPISTDLNHFKMVGFSLGVSVMGGDERGVKEGKVRNYCSPPHIPGRSPIPQVSSCVILHDL